MFSCSIKSKYKSAHTVSNILKCNVTYKSILLKSVYVLYIYLKFKLKALIHVLRKASNKINNILSDYHTEIFTDTGVKVLLCTFPLCYLYCINQPLKSLSCSSEKKKNEKV